MIYNSKDYIDYFFCTTLLYHDWMFLINVDSKYIIQRDIDSCWFPCKRREYISTFYNNRKDLGDTNHIILDHI